MIIDRIRLAGLDAYFKDPGNPGKTNLATQVKSRTAPLGKGKQLEISGIQLLLEAADGNDLRDLFCRQDEVLFSISVMKEMFPRVFADPFQNRVHTIAGFDDFGRGQLNNGRVMDIDGIPTIVSTGTEECTWTSPMYVLPEPIKITGASWDLAASTKTPAESFTYGLTLIMLDGPEPGSPAQAAPLAVDLDPTAARKNEGMEPKAVQFFQVKFTANVKRDAGLYERHSTLVGASIGTPLLRAVNLLEPIGSLYDISSLQELIDLSTDYHLLECEGQPMTRMLARLNLPATLIHSDYAQFENSRYEFIEIHVRTDKFRKFEAKLKGEILLRPAASPANTVV